MVGEYGGITPETMRQIIKDLQNPKNYEGNEEVWRKLSYISPEEMSKKLGND